MLTRTGHPLRPGRKDFTSMKPNETGYTRSVCDADTNRRTATSVINYLTRMHSSRVRTARLLTISRSIPRGGLPNPPWMQTPPPGCIAPTGRPPWMHTPQSCDVWCMLGSQPPPTCEQIFLGRRGTLTHRHKNITLPQTFVCGGNNRKILSSGKGWEDQTQSFPSAWWVLQSCPFSARYIMTWTGSIWATIYLIFQNLEIGPPPYLRCGNMEVTALFTISPSQRIAGEGGVTKRLNSLSTSYS